MTDLLGSPYLHSYKSAPKAYVLSLTTSFTRENLYFASGDILL